MNNRSTFIHTPKALRFKRIVNVHNTRDNRCFLYSVLAAILSSSSDFNHEKRIFNRNNRQKPSTYKPFFHRLNMRDISFPVKVSDLPKFERLNPDIAVNVLGE